MASRMDRYTKSEVPSGRSDRNKSLYKRIEDLDSYTNIAGITTIENKNEIDIQKVRELLRNKEDIKEKREKEIEEVIIEEDNRNHDIRDLLNKVKSENTKYRSLSEKQNKILKKLNERSETKTSKEELKDNLNDLLNTISTTEISEENSDDVGLLDDLKSDTMVGDAPSIKQIIEAEKDFTKEIDTVKLDKSFYTSSFGFTQKDFEELKDINHKIKKDNKFIITLLIILILIIIVGVFIYFIK